MADDGKNSPFGFNWKQFEEFFSGISSFQQGKIQDLGWVDKFIQNMLKQAVPEPGAKSVQSSPLHAEVFETHRNVIVKIRIPAHIEPRALQLFANSHQLKIEGPGQNVQFVRLPAAVHSHSSKAVFQDGILQLQLRKKIKTERFDEVFIRFH